MRRMLKRIAALLAGLTLLSALAACGEITGLDAPALMSPPKTTADRQASYSLLCGEENDVTLVYPKNGDYRSAIISRDLDGDGVSEVVGFCAAGDTGGIRLQFMAEDEAGAWRSLAQFTSTSTLVDRVFFGDLTGDGTEEIVVGWGDPQTATASISVYSLKDGAVRELSMNAVAYSEMLLTDFDGDGVQELFVMDLTRAGKGEEAGASPLGSLYRFDGEQPYVALTVPLDSAVTRYSGALFTKLNSWRSGVVLDGVKADGRMVTQVIGYDEVAERLTAPLSESGDANPTDRDTAAAVSARDINGDGVTEIPTASLVMEPAEGSAADSTAYTITWNTYSLSDNTLTPVCSSIVNTAENYIVVLPESEAQIACANDSVTRTSTFFRYERMAGAPAGREDLFAVTVYSEEEWEAREEAGETKEEIYLTAMGGRVYALAVLDPSLSADSALIRSVCADFKILNE